MGGRFGDYVSWCPDCGCVVPAEEHGGASGLLHTKCGARLLRSTGAIVEGFTAVLVHSLAVSDRERNEARAERDAARDVAAARGDCLLRLGAGQDGQHTADVLARLEAAEPFVRYAAVMLSLDDDLRNTVRLRAESAGGVAVITSDDLRRLADEVEAALPFDVEGDVSYLRGVARLRRAGVLTERECAWFLLGATVEEERDRATYRGDLKRRIAELEPRGVDAAAEDAHA